MSAPESLTADQALVRLGQYRERASAWSTATYNDGTERALAEIAGALAAEVERLRAITDGPVCSEDAARAVGLDVPPGVAELEAMAEAMLRAYGDEPSAMADLSRGLLLAMTEIRRLRHERSELVEELGGRDEEARERWVERELERTGLRAMDFRNGMSMEIEPAREMVAHWVGAARAMLGDAENYSETPIEMEVGVAEDPQRYAFVLQRVGRVTPHQARQRAEAEAEQLRGRVAELEVELAARPLRAEVLREAQDATVAWLESRAAEERSVAWQEEKRRATARARRHRERADLISTLASKVFRNAVRVFLAAVPSQPSRAETLRQVADDFERRCPDEGAADALELCYCHVAPVLRTLADEAEPAPTPDAEAAERGEDL